MIPSLPDEQKMAAQSLSPEPLKSVSFRDRVARRSRALALTRAFFAERDFLEVDAPQLVPAPTTEPHIDPLWVRVRPSLDEGAEPLVRYLHTSPELALKRVLANGVERVYSLTHVFRDGEVTERHLPEFAMLEWYRAKVSLSALVRDCEDLLRSLAKALVGTTTLPRADGGALALEEPFEVRTVAELFARHADVDLPAALARMADGEESALPEAVKKAGHKLRPGADFEDAFFHVMLARVEPAIGLERPCVVTRWPRQMAILARGCDDDPLFAERFELYAGGLELANAFDELTDPVEQRARFLEDNEAREALGKAPLPLDELFLEELQRMPASSGIAVGFDRVLMLLFGAREITEVVPVPFR